MTLNTKLVKMLEEQAPQVIEMLNACHQTTKAAKQVDSLRLRLTEDQAREVYKELDSALYHVNSIKEQLGALIEKKHHLRALVDALHCELTLTDVNDNNVEFNFTPQMIQSIEFAIEAESEYNDEGGTSTYYRLGSLSVSIDRDIVMAMAPDFFRLDAGDHMSDDDEGKADDGLSDEDLAKFMEAFEEDVAEQLMEAIEYSDLEWRAFDRIEPITQAQLAMVDTNACSAELPALYEAD